MTLNTNILVKGGNMENKDLIQRLKNRDEDALYVVIEVYGKVLKGVISKTLWKYPSLWDEAMNDSLLSIWQNIDYFDPKRSSFKNWCAAVSKYKAIDLLRRESKFEAILLDENSASKDSDVHSNLEIEEILSALNDEDKKLFENIFIRGLSYGEAASEQHISTENAYQKVSRARKLLRRWRGENV